MRRRITIELSVETFAALVEQAARDRRTPREQAAWIVDQALASDTVPRTTVINVAQGGFTADDLADVLGRAGLVTNGGA